MASNPLEQPQPLEATAAPGPNWQQTIAEAYQPRLEAPSIQSKAANHLPGLEITGDLKLDSQAQTAAAVFDKVQLHADVMRSISSHGQYLTRQDVEHRLDLDQIQHSHRNEPVSKLTNGAAHDDLHYIDQHWASTKKAFIDLKKPRQDSDNQTHSLSEKLSQIESTAQKGTSNSVSEASFAHQATALIEKLDPSNHGTITKAQLAKAMEDPQYKGKEAQTLAVLYADFDDLNALSNAKNGAGQETISLKEINQYDALRNNANNWQALNDWAQDGFQRFGSKDGVLTEQDIQKALKENISADDKTYLQFIQKNYDALVKIDKNSGNDGKGINQDDLAALYHPSDAQATALSATELLLGSTVLPPDTSSALYGKGGAEASINPQGIDQSMWLSDCFVLAPLSAIAQSNPQAIEKMIKTNSDGSYTVTFPGAPDDPIRVPPPTEAEMRLYNHGGATGVWANVIEKAYGQMQTDKSLWHRVGEALGTYNQLPEASIPPLGGNPKISMQILTGSQTEVTALTGNAVTVQSEKSQIEAALAAHKVVVLGSNQSPDSQNIVGAHAYTVTGLSSDGHGGTLLLLRNPIGGMDGKNNITAVPLQKLSANFSFLYSQK